MNYKRIKLIVITLIIFILVFTTLKSLAIKINPKECVELSGELCNSDKEILNNISKEIILEDKEELWGENFIIIKDTEEVSRSSISRRDRSIEKIVQSAHNEIGKPYSYGNIGPKSYDCSGLTYSVYFNTLGIKLNRTSKDQTENGFKVEREDLILGDLVFFNTLGRKISHVGIYIGEGEMIHASFKENMVIVDDMNSNYFKSRFVTARRILY